MKYLIIVIVFVFAIVLILRRNILKDIAKRKKDDLNKKRWEEEYKEDEKKRKEEREKSPLAINKHILCDDGIKRVYNGFMFGIIKDRGKNIDARLILPEDGYLVMEEGFDLNIINEKWFSETGEVLNTNQILNSQKKLMELETAYNKSIENSFTDLAASYPYISRLCCINNIYFHCSWPKSNIPNIPFSGSIDGKFYENRISK